MKNLITGYFSFCLGKDFKTFKAYEITYNSFYFIC